MYKYLPLGLDYGFPADGIECVSVVLLVAQRLEGGVVVGQSGGVVVHGHVGHVGTWARSTVEVLVLEGVPLGAGDEAVVALLGEVVSRHAHAGGGLVVAGSRGGFLLVQLPQQTLGLLVGLHALTQVDGGVAFVLVEPQGGGVEHLLLLLLDHDGLEFGGNRTGDCLQVGLVLEALDQLSSCVASLGPDHLDALETGRLIHALLHLTHVTYNNIYDNHPYR